MVENLELAFVCVYELWVCEEIQWSSLCIRDSVEGFVELLTM